VVLAKGGTEFGRVTGAADSALIRFFRDNEYDLSAAQGDKTHTPCIAPGQSDL
jgi:hypothetical protein